MLLQPFRNILGMWFLASTYYFHLIVLYAKANPAEINGISLLFSFESQTLKTGNAEHL